MIRIFHVPDGHSYLKLLLQMTSGGEPKTAMQFWPASVVFLAHTFFTEEGRLASVNGPSGGYRRKRTGANQRGRVFMDAVEPIDFAQRHMAAAAQFARDSGAAALPQEPLDQYLRRQNALHEEERQHYVDRPYTWGDHLHWYLQRPRREYR